MNARHFFGAVVIAVVLACAVSMPQATSSNARPLNLGTVMATRTATSGPNDLCNVCIQFYGEAINIILNIILQGVVNDCSKLCAAVAQKTGSQTLGAICNLLCDIVGIEDFIKFLENADFDAIYFCELLHTCPVNDHGDAKITILSITPPTGPQGTEFKIALDFKTVNGTGTGEVDLFIRTVDGIPLGDDELLVASKPGTYNMGWTLKAAPDPSCDPTQQPCEMWLPGNYTIDVAVCNGECGSKKPHSAIYDRRSLNFTLT